jgi:hypothetical protein
MKTAIYNSDLGKLLTVAELLALTKLPFAS